MNYLRGPHSPCYGILRGVMTSQTKKNDELGSQRILACAGFRGRRVLPLEDVLTAVRGRGDEVRFFLVFISLIRMISSTHALSSDFAKPIKRRRSSSSCDSKSGDRRAPDRHSKS